jgi:mono/diheme cytochrome c family protein
MSYHATKSLLGIFFVAAGVIALVSMLTLMGRSERRLGAPALKRIHRTAGYVFAALLVVLAVLGARYLAAARDGLPLRGVIHWTLASLLVVILAIKIAIVRWYKQFLKFVPALGLAVFVVAFVVAAVSLGYFALTGAVGRGPQDGPTGATGDAEHGAAVFARNCEICHFGDTGESSMGPGLGGLFARRTLSSNGRPVTRENVRAQIVAPTGSMPAFENRLSQDELDNLIAYLETL